MGVIVSLYSDKKGEIKRFLYSFFKSDNINIDNELKWEYFFENPIESANIIGVFIDNNDIATIYGEKKSKFLKFIKIILQLLLQK